MERPRGIGAALRLGAEVLIMIERQLIAFHLDAEVPIMAEERTVILLRL